ncbi:sensor histidine kinase [Jeongeupia naejangsanensis]|uniref:histidine kinase n=1 Tax=Jeongeupia naejangsanensis TaxID=613195 RepID=A0ABS2BK39_9NEIS|nr:sensor histidine kinase [Jeongeupia naejangsanensis]MBM3115448.1 sensor histidine kinase N-terminal domain-containing protein [Jeongeupia naejangsanensis]
MPRRSLRRYLTVCLLIPLLVLLSVDAVLTYHRARQSADAAFDRSLFTSNKAMVEGISIQHGKIVVDIPYLALEMFEANASGRVYYRVVEENGAELTGYKDLPLPRHREQDYYKPLFYDADYKGETIRVAATRQRVHDVATAQARTVWVLTGETPESRRELARQILVGAIIQDLVLVALALGIVLLAVSLGLRPLRRLSAKVKEKDADDLQPLDATELPAELKPLVEAMNQYIARIERILNDRGRFFADAAHQLKTPLAVLQAKVELALREDDLPVVKKQLAETLDTVRHASRGVKQLLSLSRLAPDHFLVVTYSDVDLTSVAREVALDWAPVARRSGVDLGFEGDVAATLSGRPELLQELVGNLIDNAIRYAGPGKMVTVRCAPVDGHARLQVVDNGPGIPEEERDKVFRRFYRIAGTQVEGSGLGLGIVHEIARLHDALIALSHTPGGGLTVTVDFPVDRAAQESS